MAIILVPTDAADILTAIGLANPNDEIVLEQAGSPFQGANNRNNDPGGLDPLTIRGDTGDPVDVVVDCQNVVGTRGFYIHTGETATCIIQHLKVLNGEVGTGYGGGLYLSSEPTINNCIIQSCHARYGAGILCWVNDATIINCVIRDNSAEYGGSGVSCQNNANPTLTNCLIIGNSCTSGLSNGGGLYIKSSSATLNNCTIADNSCLNDGGGVYIDFISGTLNNCIIWGNTAGSGNQCYIDAGTLTLNYCDYANGAGDIAGGGTFNTNFCITTDPLFVAGPESYITEFNDQANQLSNWSFDGVVIGSNTDADGNIYISLSSGPGWQYVYVYKDSGRTQLVAYGLRSGHGTLTLTEQNSSGLTGSVDVAYTIDDNDIYLVFKNSYYLSQIAAGEGADSGAVDTGSDTAVNLGMDDKTTRSDQIADEGQADMGYHYLEIAGGNGNENGNGVDHAKIAAHAMMQTV